MVLAAAIYARISSDRDGDHLGVERQLSDCRDAARKRGWPIFEEYVDNDVSAYKAKVRPEYRRLLSDIKDGFVDAVIVYDQDRLTRQPRDLEEFFDICDAAGVRDLATVTGMLDLGTDSGQFTARILGAVARKSSDDMARRIRRKHDELAAQGKPSGGGNRPYGYESSKRLKVIRAEAKVIREAKDRILGGDSVGSICADFNERGITTATGKQWTYQGLHKIMTSAAISGQREHHGEIVGPAVWEAIITPAETTRLRMTLGGDRNSATAARHPRRYLLAGLLRCGRCNEILVSRPKAGGVRQYVCDNSPGKPGCGGISVLADPVEAIIVKGVLDLLDSPTLAAGLARGIVGDEEAAALQAGIGEDEAQLLELADAYGNKAMTMSQMLAASKPINARITKARKQLHRLTRTTMLDGYIGKSELLRKKWPELDLTRQAAIVKTLLGDAVIQPAVRGRNKFDPDRIEAHWLR